MPIQALLAKKEKFYKIQINRVEYFAVSNQIPSQTINSSLRGVHILHLYTIVKQNSSFWPDITLMGVEELTEEEDSLTLSTTQFLYQLSLISAEWQNNEGVNGLLEICSNLLLEGKLSSKLIRLPRAMSREILSISKDKGACALLLYHPQSEGTYSFCLIEISILFPDSIISIIMH